VISIVCSLMALLDLEEKFSSYTLYSSSFSFVSLRSFWLSVLLLYGWSLVMTRNSLCFGLQVISHKNVRKFKKHAGHRDISWRGNDKSLVKRESWAKSQHVLVVFGPLYKCGHKSFSKSRYVLFVCAIGGPRYSQLYLAVETRSDWPHSPYHMQSELT